MTLAAVVLHPHPGMGGDSTHPLVATISQRLADRGVSIATPDIDDPDFALASADLAHAASDLLAESGADGLVLVGYSWGSVVSSLVSVDGLAARVLVAPPVSMMKLGAYDGLPGLVLVPDHDEFGGPDAVAQALVGCDNLVAETVAGCDHYLVGAVDRIAARVVEWTTAML